MFFKNLAACLLVSGDLYVIIFDTVDFGSEIRKVAKEMQPQMTSVPAAVT
jgi:hypothetical protein